MFDYNSFRNAVIEANSELYEYINTHLSSADLEDSNTISYGGDHSLNIDLKAENIFIKYLSSFGDIFSEEIGLVSSNSNIKIIIDPLDGSNNFLSNLPYFATSVALKIDNELKAGYICNLVNGILIFRENNLEVRQLSILTKKFIPLYHLKSPSIAIFERAYRFLNISKKLSENKIKYRSCGAIALSLANARNYKFVLFAGQIREFDIAAGIYINGNLNIYQNNKFLLVCKNKEYFEFIKEIIKQE
ncbi:MAG: inositol monophosphatase family protein [Halarcobacter sp.]